MNEALEEAMLLARHEGQPVETVRVWQNARAMVLGRGEEAGTSLVDRCKENRIVVVRRASSGKTAYQDRGTLNVSYVVSQRALLPDIDNLLEVYRQLHRPIARSLSTLGIDAKVDYYGERTMIDGRLVSQAWFSFYYDLLLFQVCLNVDTDLNLEASLLKNGQTATTLSQELGREVEIFAVEEAVTDSIAKMLRLEFREQDITTLEKELAQRLHQIKYSKDDWNLRRQGPLSVKDVLVEAYVAYPPTKSCRQLIENIRSAVAALEDKVEVRIWMRGKGLNGQGSPPGVPMSHGLMEAVKKSLIPAIVLNGEMAFLRVVPSAADVKRRIMHVLERPA